MGNLFQLTKRAKELEDLIDPIQEGDVSEEVAAQLAKFLIEAKEDFAQKVDDYASVISELEARAEMRDAEAARITALAKSDSKRAAWLAQMLKESLAAREIKKIQTPRYRVSVAGNGGIQPMVLFPNEDIPPEFQKTVTTTETDTQKIRAALEAGEILTFAMLKPRGDRLAIK